MIGKYFLDGIGDKNHTTNDYSIYYWYNKLFYDFDVHIDTYKHEPKERLDPVYNVDKGTLKKALRNEAAHYENGYIYKSEWFLIRGKKLKKGRWVKDPVRAKLIFESIKEKHKELFLND